MRILMGVHGLPPFSVGGTELVAFTVAGHLAGRHQVTLFHPLPAALGPVGLEFQRVQRGVHVVGRILASPRRFEDTYHLPSAGAWFERLLDTVSPDVVIFHHLTGLSLRLPGMARARGIPVVMTLHDYWPLCARGQLMDVGLRVCPGPGAFRCADCLADQLLMLSPWAGLGRAWLASPLGGGLAPVLRRLVLSASAPRISRGAGSTVGDREARAAADRIVAGRDALASCECVTGPSRHILETYLPWLPRGAQVRLVRNSVPRRPVSRPQRPPGSPLRLGFLGAVIPTKGVHVLLDACQGLVRRHLEVDIAGPTPRFHRQPDYARRMADRAREMGIVFRGALAPGKVPAWMSRLHALVVPSLWPENAPRVVAEAFRLGVPVIASETGGIPEWVHHDENGALLPPGDVERWRGQIEAVLSEPGLLRRWADGAWDTPLTSPEEERSAWEALVVEVASSSGAKNLIGDPGSGLL